MKLSLLSLVVLLSSCASVLPARALGTAADYQALKLKPDTIEPWEDGLRTTGEPGTYEWWYFDAHLADGSTLVVVFYTKPMTSTGGGLAPHVQVDLTRADGTKVASTIPFPVNDFFASKEKCDVAIGKNRFWGDLQHARIVVDLKDIGVDLTLKSTVPAWRPAAGVIGFGEHDEKYFAWLPSIPQGDVTGSVRVDGKTVPITGVGYHDHNWGNASLTELLHDWYWGRARVGDYSLIAAYMTSEEKFANATFPILLVAKGNEVLVGDAKDVTFTRANVHTDPLTGKPVGDDLTWTVGGDHPRLRLTFHRERDLVHEPMANGFPPLQRFLASLAGFDGAYHRFTGPVTLERFENDAVVERVTNNEAIWELMYFGKAPR